MAFHKKYIVSIIVLSLFPCILGQNKCGKLDTNGYTVPHGDIVLRYGEPLDITCNLYPKCLEQYGTNASSRLYFTRNNEPFPPEMVETINSTSIRIHIANHTKAKGDNYYCLFRANNGIKIICLNVVIVGVPPTNVTDFSCISRNYDNLTCTWTPPETFVRTDSNLTYYLKGRAARKQNHTKSNRVEGRSSKSNLGSGKPKPIKQRFLYQCPKLVKLDNGKMSCFWNVSTDPQYRPVHGMFYFRIGMNNTFGSITNNFVFEHFRRVLPNPPENLTAVATSPHSIHLSWIIPSSMVNFIPGLHHRILYQCEYYNKVWQFGGLITKHKKNKTLEFDLEGLKYAHALCDIRVSMRSAVADENDESMWSDNATITVRTKSKVPDCPPKTNIGSFELVNNAYIRDAYVYWQQLREEQKNGQNFTYHVEVENHPSVRPVELSKAYARFLNLSSSDNYIVNIWSKNEEGYSVEKSTVTIPANRISEPLNFIKVAHNSNLYELSWEPSRHSEGGVEDPQITNYTIFWCSNERDRPYQCVGNLNWTVVPKDTKKYNQTLPGNNIYQFAISANTQNSSSGMSWAECTVIPNRVVGKIKNVWIMNVGSHFIEIGWELDCSNRIGPIKGFIIYYCPVESPVLINCNKTTERNITVKGNVQPYKITGLKPYTTYSLTVGFIINQSTYSQTSEPLLNTTHEAAPSVPCNIQVINVTNSSIYLKWEPPQERNGILKYYTIDYGYNDPIKIDPYQNEAVLKNLKSFVNYSIAIRACTVECSPPSTISVLTKMWVPGEITQPTVINIDNETPMTIIWDKPDPPRGVINYYEVQFKSENTTLKYKNVTTRNYTVEGCSSGQYKSMYVSVRAVNIVDGEHLHGPWSAPLSISCTYTNAVYILIAVSLLVLVVGITCLFKRLYKYYKMMQNVEIKLPPGLAPVVEHDLVPWSSEKHVEDIDRSSRADEELLLQQISEIRLSGESSGCSSAHESITESLESANHISPTDSGTEHPRSPSLSEESRRNSLRQRNVSATRPTINKGYVLPEAVPATNWAPKSSPTPAGNYCVLGVDPANQTETESPYVPISDVNATLQMPYTSDLSQPPPYVITGDFIKTPNPGYVPYSATEPADKNTGYVVAGLTKDLLASELLQCDTPKSTSIEETPLYSKAADPTPNLKGVQFPWQQPSLETTLPKSGYVAVGDAPSPKTISDVTKGYVPHRQFEAKSLKED